MIKIDPALADKIQDVAKVPDKPVQPTLFALPAKKQSIVYPAFNTSTAWVSDWVKSALRYNRYKPNCKSMAGYEAALNLFCYAQFTPEQESVAKQAIKEYLGLN